MKGKYKVQLLVLSNISFLLGLVVLHVIYNTPDYYDTIRIFGIRFPQAIFLDIGITLIGVNYLISLYLMFKPIEVK